MPFKSEAQRRFMYAKHPELAKEFQAATPKGAKLPEHASKKEGALAEAYAAGVDAAFLHFKLARSEEVRLKIPRREYHGWDKAWRETEKTKKAGEGAQPLEPQGNPDSPVEKLTGMLQKIDSPSSPSALAATKDPLDRTTFWGGATNPEAGDTGTRDPGLNVGLNNVGTAF